MPPDRHGEYDVFISHASEDKQVFVAQLADALRRRNLRVWYDDFVLRVGDRLRQSVETGLQSSRYGIVVLSPRFFEKRWPQQELDGLAQLERVDGRDRLLPVWLEVSWREVATYSPMLADIVAVHASDGVDHVANAILDRVQPGRGPDIGPGDAAIEPPDCAEVQLDDWIAGGSLPEFSLAVANRGQAPVFDVSWALPATYPGWWVPDEAGNSQAAEIGPGMAVISRVVVGAEGPPTCPIVLRGRDHKGQIFETSTYLIRQRHPFAVMSGWPIQVRAPLTIFRQVASLRSDRANSRTPGSFPKNSRKRLWQPTRCSSQSPRPGLSLRRYYGSPRICTTPVRLPGRTPQSTTRIA